ncbi:MAG: rRNA metabolism protein, SBDS family [Candidatus Syntrophoarchaeum caldarius]|uniref:rRNA metabolism protein, SBDS family n=1 Tax=Candidatus Syntropharchaeum caldarium TaxID=1838285 RepID=A0A1F2PBP5_9EURY|nr:MAG: rRNA metabolism protein, SBDS family [Candidatus Syntrophoarchaeum caldarius]
MVSLDDAVIARFKRHGLTFEIFVDPELALSFKHGKDLPLEEILAVEDVFTDAAAGDRASETDLNTAFETLDLPTIAARIIKEGELQLTAAQRKRMQEDKRRQVINIIARNGINPQTMTPHPPQRIERAMEEAGVNIDPFKRTDDLVNEAMKAIRPIIPIRFEEVRIAVKIPAAYTSGIYELKNHGDLIKEEWQNDGSWIGIIKIPAGIQDEFYGLINRITKGEAETKLLKE